MSTPTVAPSTPLAHPQPTTHRPLPSLGRCPPHGLPLHGLAGGGHPASA